MRTEPFQLPTYQELESILSHEEKRLIPTKKKDLHYGDFSTIVNLLRSYNMQTRIFEEDVRFEDLKDSGLFSEIISTFSELLDNILRTQDDVEKQKLFNNIYDYLSEEDEIEKADVIFVFGAKSTFRIEKAVELYKKGYAPKILISGKGPFYDQNKEVLSEAEKLAKYALGHGVPKKALILEKKSITVPDNVKRSLNLLERKSIHHKNIILVNSMFSQRRGWAHFNKMSSQDTKLIRINVDKVSEHFSRDGWYKNEIGIKVILKEFFGLRVSEMLNTS